MNLSTFEFTQRAEGGGSPLDNETAHELGIGHGTPLVVLPKRQFVALLKRAQEAAASVSVDYDLLQGVEDYLKENDQFVVRVKSNELFGANEAP